MQAVHIVRKDSESRVFDVLPPVLPMAQAALADITTNLKQTEESCSTSRYEAPQPAQRKHLSETRFDTPKGVTLPSEVREGVPPEIREYLEDFWSDENRPTFSQYWIVLSHLGFGAPQAVDVALEIDRHLALFYTRVASNLPLAPPATTSRRTSLIAEACLPDFHGPQTSAARPRGPPQ